MNGLRFVTVLSVLLLATPLCAQPSRPLAQETQQVLDRLARAEVTREDDKRGLQIEAVREQFRAAISQIRAIEKDLAPRLQHAYQQKPSTRDKNSWTVQELESLGRNLKVQLARAYRNQALCYPAGSADRVNALSLALEPLLEVIPLPLDDASVWQARVEQIVCLRLLQKPAEAQQQIERWRKASPPKKIASRLAVELRNLELESGNLTSALAQEDPKLLNFAAASLYTTGKLGQAVDVYDRIAALQATQRNRDRQFQALKTAAAIVREMKKIAEALIRFRELALRDPRHDESASVHLMAIGLGAELVREAPPKQHQERFQFYVTLLNEHLQQWPKSPTSEKVREWLARTEQPKVIQDQAQTLAIKGDRQQALTLYRKLLNDSPDDAKLLETFAKLLAAGTKNSELREALQVWQTLESRSKPASPRWWRGRRARLALLEQLGEGGQAKKLRQLTEILYE